jgi:2-polyprenyl-3-methyl-5-hydroxy-6-metoxy-1,4-benzoquinol methylase
MPVNIHDTSEIALSQRILYSNSYLTRIYWNEKDKIISSLIPKNVGSILDLGCGEGITLQHLTNTFQNASVMGVEYLYENIDICIKHNLGCIQGDVYNLEFQENSMDTVVFMEVIEHLDDPQGAISEIFRILKPNGVLIIGFPNDRFFLLSRLLLLKLKEARYDPGHVKQWTPREMKCALEYNGFINLKIQCIPLGLWPISLHCIIAAKKPSFNTET